MENEYNKRFKNKEMSNDDFDVEGLWGDITEELDEKSGGLSASSWNKLGGALFILLILSGIGFAILNSDSSNYLETNKPVADSQKIENETQKSGVAHIF